LVFSITVRVQPHNLLHVYSSATPTVTVNTMVRSTVTY